MRHCPLLYFSLVGLKAIAVNCLETGPWPHLGIPECDLVVPFINNNVGKSRPCDL
jgi:hypothetical protein